jgi:hypothetical protein
VAEGRAQQRSSSTVEQVHRLHGVTAEGICSMLDGLARLRAANHGRRSPLHRVEDRLTGRVLVGVKEH